MPISVHRNLLPSPVPSIVSSPRYPSADRPPPKRAARVPLRRRPCLAPVVAVAGLLAVSMAGCGKSPPPAVTVQRLATAPGAVLNAACSPDGRMLAFDSGLSGRFTLWTSPVSGGPPRTLCAQEGRRPAWSPDGKWVAFESAQTGDWDIYLVSAAGGAPVPVTNLPGADWGPCWSPDGKHLAFMSNRDSVSVWVAAVDRPAAVRIGPAGSVNPAWSPDGKRLAFQARSAGGNWDIFSVGLEGGEPRRLTSDTSADLDPAWAPDGQTIAFRTLSRQGADIAAVPAEGGSPSRLTRNGGADGPPVWSPDGRRIAFLSYAASGSIAVVPAGGGQTRTLFAGVTQPGSLVWLPAGDRLLFCAKSADLWAVSAAGGEPSRLTNDLFEDRKPDVSPDGRRIVFESTRDGSPGLWILDAGGGVPRPLLARSDSAADAHPRFSPDGGRVAFTSSRGETGRQTDLWTVSADGSNLNRGTTLPGLKGRPTWFVDNARLIFESNMGGAWGIWALEPPARVTPLPIPKPAMRPAWSPDGWWLVYQSERGGNWDLYLTQMKSGEERRLTAGPAYESDPAWSRDGRRIAFASNRSGNDDLYVMDPAGQVGEVTVTSGPDEDTEPAWFPDGARIVFVRVERQSVWSVTVP